METKQTILTKIFELLEEGQPNQALVCALEFEQNNPNDVEIMDTIAGIYDLMNDIVRSLEYHIKVLKTGKYKDVTNFKIGEMLYILQKRNPELCEQYTNEWEELAGKDLIAKISIKSLKNEKNEYSSEYIKSLFDNFAGCFDNVLNGLFYLTPRKISQQLEKIATKQYRIIDFGCGTGLCGELIRKYAASLVGVDISDEMLNKARQKSVYDELVCADILEYSTMRKFEIGISGDVFTYFEDISIPLKKLSELIEEGGSMLVSFSYPPKFTFKDSTQETAGRYLHSKRYIKKEIKKNGLKIVSVLEYNQRKELKSFIKGGLFLIKK